MKERSITIKFRNENLWKTWKAFLKREKATHLDRPTAITERELIINAMVEYMDAREREQKGGI